MSKVNKKALLIDIANTPGDKLVTFDQHPISKFYAPIEEEKLPKKWGEKKPRVNIEQIEVIPQKRKWQNSETKKKSGQGTRWVGLRTGNSDNMKIQPIDVVSCKS